MTMASSIDVPLESPAPVRIAARTTIEGLLRRIRAEYLEVPGLNLTRQQARRLWGLDEATCDNLLTTLVNAHFLRVTASGLYVRAD
jgi:hypothetical protein